MWPVTLSVNMCTSSVQGIQRRPKVKLECDKFMKVHSTMAYVICDCITIHGLNNSQYSSNLQYLGNILQTLDKTLRKFRFEPKFRTGLQQHQEYCLTNTETISWKQTQHVLQEANTKLPHHHTYFILSSTYTTHHQRTEKLVDALAFVSWSLLGEVKHLNCPKSIR